MRAIHIVLASMATGLVVATPTLPRLWRASEAEPPAMHPHSLGSETPQIDEQETIKYRWHTYMPESQRFEPESRDDIAAATPKAKRRKTLQSTKPLAATQDMTGSNSNKSTLQSPAPVEQDKTRSMEDWFWSFLDSDPKGGYAYAEKSIINLS